MKTGSKFVALVFVCGIVFSLSASASSVPYSAPLNGPLEATIHGSFTYDGSGNTLIMASPIGSAASSQVVLNVIGPENLVGGNISPSPTAGGRNQQVPEGGTQASYLVLSAVATLLALVGRRRGKTLQLG